jgi:hypothetical protein
MNKKNEENELKEDKNKEKSAEKNKLERKVTKKSSSKFLRTNKIQAKRQSILPEIKKKN